ncbi:hypothetical protein RchiOBHm_Chr1g0375731 [Rosa chinensis]|uniref:Uncharacterized protein n=1 Tax=Rosa chinensis TaxID=74649 RepID=A0A2P6SMP6_ROSCH|nr:hypothetical protein RchiOBHm_Chr1g0375731 [Rosa chinensis]
MLMLNLKWIRSLLPLISSEIESVSFKWIDLCCWSLNYVMF